MAEHPFRYQTVNSPPLQYGWPYASDPLVDPIPELQLSEDNPRVRPAPGPPYVLDNSIVAELTPQQKLQLCLQEIELQERYEEQEREKKRQAAQPAIDAANKWKQLCERQESGAKMPKRQPFWRTKEEGKKYADYEVFTANGFRKTKKEYRAEKQEKARFNALSKEEQAQETNAAREKAAKLEAEEKEKAEAAVQTEIRIQAGIIGVDPDHPFAIEAAESTIADRKVAIADMEAARRAAAFATEDRERVSTAGGLNRKLPYQLAQMPEEEELATIDPAFVDGLPTRFEFWDVDIGADILEPLYQDYDRFMTFMTDNGATDVMRWNHVCVKMRYEDNDTFDIDTPTKAQMLQYRRWYNELRAKKASETHQQFLQRIIDAFQKLASDPGLLKKRQGQAKGDMPRDLASYNIFKHYNNVVPLRIQFVRTSTPHENMPWKINEMVERDVKIFEDYIEKIWRPARAPDSVPVGIIGGAYNALADMAARLTGSTDSTKEPAQEPPPANRPGTGSPQDLTGVPVKSEKDDDTVVPDLRTPKGEELSGGPSGPRDALSGGPLAKRHPPDDSSQQAPKKRWLSCPWIPITSFWRSGRKKPKLLKIGPPLPDPSRIQVSSAPTDTSVQYLHELAIQTAIDANSTTPAERYPLIPLTDSAYNSPAVQANEPSGSGASPALSSKPDSEKIKLPTWDPKTHTFSHGFIYPDNPERCQFQIALSLSLLTLASMFAETGGPAAGSIAARVQQREIEALQNELRASGTGPAGINIGSPISTTAPGFQRASRASSKHEHNVAIVTAHNELRRARKLAKQLKLDLITKRVNFWHGMYMVRLGQTSRARRLFASASLASDTCWEGRAATDFLSKGVERLVRESQTRVDSWMDSASENRPRAALRDASVSSAEEGHPRRTAADSLPAGLSRSGSMATTRSASSRHSSIAEERHSQDEFWRTGDGGNSDQTIVPYDREGAQTVVPYNREDRQAQATDAGPSASFAATSPLLEEAAGLRSLPMAEAGESDGEGQDEERTE
ncbi:MAG: hypothetical protein M1814_001548 [Vezdaea aestivalis]|nr:MAG: hypothetical protein M1814_001548 [Vezdaea aestivalis]